MRVRGCDGENIDQAQRQILDSFRIVARPAAYYTQYLDADGIWIKTVGKIDPRALHAAADTVNLMLASSRSRGREDMRTQLPEIFTFMERFYNAA